MKHFITTLLMLTVSFVASAQHNENATVNKEWQSYLQEMEPIAGRLSAKLMNSDDELLRKELYQILFSGMAAAYHGRFLSDASHPEFWPVLNQAHNFGTPNPDDTYYLAPLSGDGVYKITGYRGSARVVDFQVGGGQYYITGQLPLPKTYANYNADKIADSKTGFFEVVLAAKRPKGYEGEFWSLHEDATHVLLRQISYDPLTEIDGRFAINRLDTPAIKPRLTAQQIDKNLRDIPAWAESWTHISLDWVNRYIKDGLINKVAVRDLVGDGGIATQRYAEGIFKIEEGEALIYEVKVPETCPYWSISLNDAVWRTIDYTNRQSNLNGHSAVIDEDGWFRAAITAKDPGIANWLDSAGYKEGTIMNRWLECDDIETPKLTLVKFNDISKNLPTDTVTVTAEQRDDAIRQRRIGKQLRRRW